MIRCKPSKSLYMICYAVGPLPNFRQDWCSRDLPKHLPAKVSLSPDFGAVPSLFTALNLRLQMNALPAASLGRTHSSGGSIGNASTNTALTSPTSAKGRRKRVPSLDSSPDSADDGYEANGDRRRQPGVKRACNECRQQKVGSFLGFSNSRLIAMCSASVRRCDGTHLPDLRTMSTA